MNGAVKTSGGLRTREEILDAALRLFLRQGYHATGMREIAREAGVSLGAAYNHFSSKEQILEELLEHNNMYGTMAAAISRAHGDTTAELLQSAFTEIMASLEGKVHYPLLVFMDVQEFQGRHVGKLAVGAIPTVVGFFRRIYSAGAARGEMREVSPMLAMRTFIGMVFSSFIIESLASNLNIEAINLLALHEENWQQGMVDILLHGVLKEGTNREG